MISFLLPILLVHLSAVLAATGPPSPSLRSPKPQPFGFFVNNTIYQPTGNQSITYPRYVELQDGTLLVTASLMGPNPAYFPVFESTDGGASWEWVSNITDTVNGWGLPAQPALAELTEPLGKLPAGTLLASGNSWSNNGTRIDLYTSTDRARSWKFVSHIAEGGRPNTTNGATPVWEPFLLIHNHTLITYYSDQRSPSHGQLLAHQSSTDLVTWSTPPTVDVAYTEYLARPGMSIVAYIPPLKKYMLVYEFPVGNSSSHGVNYPVYYRLASDPTEFRFAEGVPIVVTKGNRTVAPNASPYVAWSEAGGTEWGTIVVSDADSGVVYTNRWGGEEGKWELWETPAGATYSRAIGIQQNRRGRGRGGGKGGDGDRLMIFGGETFDGMGEGLLTPLSLTVVSLGDVLRGVYK